MTSAPHGSTSFAYAKYDSAPATSITVATSMTSILFENFIRLKTFPCEIVAHLPRVAPIKCALRQKAWRYAPFAAKTALYRRPLCFGLRMYSLLDSRNLKSEFTKPDSPQKAGGPRESAAECTAFPLGISPSITERGVLSRKVCQICRTSTLPTGASSYNMPESYRLPSVLSSPVSIAAMLWS